jgi:hypothetical protein
MSGLAGRRRRRSRNDGSGRIATGRRTGGLVRWQGAPRRGVGARLVLALAVGAAVLLLILALIAARTNGALQWVNLLMLVPAGVLVLAFGAGLVALVRRAVAWLAG